MRTRPWFYLMLLVLLLLLSVEGEKDEKRKKNILDLSERDVQRIYEQWEVYIATKLATSISYRGSQSITLQLTGE